LGIATLPVELAGAIYSFGFERGSRLIDICLGREVKGLSWTEKVFNNIGPKWLKLILLPFFITASLLNKRLILLLYSTVGKYLLICVLSAGVAFAAYLLGYDAAHSAEWLGYILKFNLLEFIGSGIDKVFNTGLKDWLHLIAEAGGLKGAIIQIFSIFGILNSLMLGFIMTYTGWVKKTRSGSGLGIFRAMTYSIKDRNMWSAVKKSMMGIHFVGAEIEGFKLIGEFHETAEELILKIEGRHGVIGLGNEFSSNVLSPLGMDLDGLTVPWTQGMTMDDIGRLNQEARTIDIKERELKWMERDIQKLEKGGSLTEEEVDRWNSAVDMEIQKAGQELKHIEEQMMGYLSGSEQRELYAAKEAIERRLAVLSMIHNWIPVQHQALLNDFKDLRDRARQEMEQAERNYKDLVKKSRGEKVDLAEGHAGEIDSGIARTVQQIRAGMQASGSGAGAGAGAGGGSNEQDLGGPKNPFTAIPILSQDTDDQRDKDAADRARPGLVVAKASMADGVLGAIKIGKSVWDYLFKHEDKASDAMLAVKSSSTGFGLSYDGAPGLIGTYSYTYDISLDTIEDVLTGNKADADQKLGYLADKAARMSGFLPSSFDTMFGNMQENRDPVGPFYWYGLSLAHYVENIGMDKSEAKFHEAVRTANHLLGIEARYMTRDGKEAGIVLKGPGDPASAMEHMLGSFDLFRYLGEKITGPDGQVYRDAAKRIAIFISTPVDRGGAYIDRDTYLRLKAEGINIPEVKEDEARFIRGIGNLSAFKNGDYTQLTYDKDGRYVRGAVDYNVATDVQAWGGSIVALYGDYFLTKDSLKTQQKDSWSSSGIIEYNKRALTLFTHLGEKISGSGGQAYREAAKRITAFLESEAKAVSQEEANAYRRPQLDAKKFANFLLNHCEAGDVFNGRQVRGFDYIDHTLQRYGQTGQ
jgi:hypothetical protein